MNKFTDRFGLNSKILFLALAPFIAFNVFMLVTNYKATKAALIQEKKYEIEDVLLTSMGVLNTLEEKVQKKVMTKKEAQEFAAAYLKKMRYGRDKNDYIWVNDFEPNMVIHPSSKLEGKSMKTFKDKAGKPLFVDIVNLAKEKKEGYVDYIWVSKKDPNILAPKLSFIKTFEPWGWILGTGIYLDDVDEYVFKLFVKESIIVISALIIVAAGIFLVIRSGVVTPLLKIAERLKSTANNVTTGSEETLETSQILSQATSDQAASLQQTVASIDEISAMIARNSESAQESRKTSTVSQNVAESGKGTVDQMLNSIHEITKNNNEAMRRMEDSNKQVGDILNIIREIEDKTKVINDIVFQTKLLSFNASVEAARAGESGKGFAVVAEEVGNLASMSGKASEEIKELLDQSIKQVEGIVSQTTNMVESIIKEGSSTVDEGTQKAQECKTALDEILGNVKDVNMKVNEIAEACGEQSTGVDEITKAMRLLDQVTNQNNDAANRASNSAEKLKTQADNLDIVVEDVLSLVNGKNKAA
jgi:methyl-accepting chemotaxis protein